MPETSPWLTPSRALLLFFAYEMASPCRGLASQLVVGVQSDPMGGLVSALHIVIRVARAVAVDETITPTKGSRVGFPQPWERLVSAPGGGAADVDVAVEAFGAPFASPLLTRRASTRFVPGKTELLRLQLELPCVVYPPRPDGIKMPGPLSGPTCVAPMTCIMGSCQSDVVRPDGLEPYAPDWPTNAPDRCKRRDAGPPALQIGTGQTSYLPLAPGQTLQAEAGPQGGHHIWIATRMKNLKQRLTTTRIEGVQPETRATIPPSTFVFTYAPDEGDYCKLYGLRYQLDNLGIDYKQFLGKALDVVVTLTDTSGSTAKATARIQVAPTLVNP
jgi:hypothetical protein